MQRQCQTGKSRHGGSMERINSESSRGTAPKPMGRPQRIRPGNVQLESHNSMTRTMDKEENQFHRRTGLRTMEQTMKSPTGQSTGFAELASQSTSLMKTSYIKNELKSTNDHQAKSLSQLQQMR